MGLTHEALAIHIKYYVTYYIKITFYCTISVTLHIESDH